MDFGKVAPLLFVVLSTCALCALSQDDLSQQIQNRIIDAPGDLTQAQCEQIYRQIAPPSGGDDSAAVTFICSGLLQQRRAKKNPTATPKPKPKNDEDQE